MNEASGVLVVASSYEQACIAAEKAGLTLRSYPNGDWFYVSTMQQVSGVLPKRVIFARPFLNLREMRRQEDVEELLCYRCVRSQIEPEYVRT